MATGIPFNPTGAPGGAVKLNVGFGYSGTPRAASGIPGMGNIAIGTSVRPTNSFGTNSFTSVMAHYVVISNPDPMDPNSTTQCRELGLGMLVFARDTQYQDPKHRRRVGARYDGVSVGPNTVELKELTQLNEYLQQHSHEYDSADAIVAEWRLLGVVKAEAAPTNYQYPGTRVSRILNLVVSHRVSVFNYWVASKIVQTQKLYIVFKRVNVGDKNVWQAVPWTSPNSERPGLKDLDAGPAAPPPAVPPNRVAAAAARAAVGAVEVEGEAPPEVVVPPSVVAKIDALKGTGAEAITAPELAKLVAAAGGTPPKFSHGGVKPFRFTSQSGSPGIKLLVFGHPLEESAPSQMGAFIYVGRSSDQSWAQHGGLNSTPVSLSTSLVKRGLMNTLEVYLGI